MRSGKNHTPFSSDQAGWLEPLRRHSWEMELLLTGFVLIGLLQLPAQLRHLQEMLMMQIEGSSLFKAYAIFMPFNIFKAGVRIMTINLVFLLLLRGFWIGMIGLSSVFPGGINHENLSFARRFSRYYREQTLDTEGLIVRLDNICSSVFALAFLVFFLIISLGLYLTQLQILTSLAEMAVNRAVEGEHIYAVVAIISLFLIFVYLLGFVLKVIDFFSIGLLKKIRKKWFERPYFFLSRFTSFVSLAFIYRPIYYILASNYPKYVIRIVFLFYILLAGSIFFNFTLKSDHLYYPQFYRNQYEMSYNEYENLRPDPDRVIQSVMIQSDVIRDNHIRLYIPYHVDDNKKLKSRCPELEPLRLKFESYIPFLHSVVSVEEADVKRALECFSDLYRISIDDSVCTDLTFFFYRHPQNDEPGIITHIPVAHLQPGYHALKILQAGHQHSNIIQFWKE